MYHVPISINAVMGPGRCDDNFDSHSTIGWLLIDSHSPSDIKVPQVQSYYSFAVVVTFSFKLHLGVILLALSLTTSLCL